MAYFPNGRAGEAFDRQCMRCKYGDKACPIALVQMVHNYEAVGNKVATEILGTLVSDQGVCAMFKMDPKGFGQQEAAKAAKAAVDDADMRTWQELNTANSGTKAVKP